ncbi:MAG TPA: cation:proton antiporter, partial [Microlunatus sp.]|nr:cation:proton antiporter [Microlunatus sp.]
MDLLEIAMIGIVAVVAVNVIAPRIKVASPLLLVLLGIAISFLPMVAPVEIEPEWILGGVLPPLLYSAAVNMPTMDFRRDLRTISAFSVLLVIGSAVIIGYVMSSLIPGIGLATGIALGAILSPTDAVATSIV